MSSERVCLCATGSPRRLRLFHTDAETATMAFDADFGDTDTSSALLRELMRRTPNTASLDALLMVLRHHGFWLRMRRQRK